MAKAKTKIRKAREKKESTPSGLRGMVIEGNQVTPDKAIHIAHPDFPEKAREMTTTQMPNRVHIRENRHLTMKFVAPSATTLAI